MRDRSRDSDPPLSLEGLRKRAKGRPRLSVFRSGLHIYVQLIDDGGGRTLAAASSVEKDLRKKLKTGGNVEGSRLNEEVDVDGVRVVGLGNLPGRVPLHASQMYSANIGNLLEQFWDEEAKAFVLDRNDEIIEGCLITHEGEVVNKTIRKNLEG